MSQAIEKLPLEYKKNAMLYKQIKRGENAAMYLVTVPETNTKVAVEVFIIKVLMNRKFKDIVYPPCEPLPSNSEFGVRAWCFGYHDGVGAENAEKRYQVIEAGTFSRDSDDSIEEEEEEEEDTDE